MVKLTSGEQKTRMIVSSSGSVVVVTAVGSEPAVHLSQNPPWITKFALFSTTCILANRGYAYEYRGNYAMPRSRYRMSPIMRAGSFSFSKSLGLDTRSS